MANLSATDVSGLELRARVPAGTGVVDSWFFQPGAFPGKNNGFDVVWSAPVSTIAAGTSVGPFVITVAIPSGQSASQFRSLGWASFQLPVPGDTVSGWIAGA